MNRRVQTYPGAASGSIGTPLQAQALSDDQDRRGDQNAIA